jgi:uncharacterized protein YqjF (DUF2071 family)
METTNDVHSAAVNTTPRQPVSGVFLSAQWRALAMINYAVDVDLVQPYVPRGCEVDLDGGQTFVSLVGFMFLGTRVLAIPVPFHRNFEEVNLRLYVKREVNGEVRRGVTFLRELVPRRAIALTARWLYNEPYWAVPMSHRTIGLSDQWEATGETVSAEYGWRWRGADYRLTVQSSGPLQPLVSGTHEHFIAEHYWGYCPQRDGGTVEYQVDHPPWHVWRVDQAKIAGDFAALYGSPWDRVLAAEPYSAFLAQGSAVQVLKPRRVS